MMLNYLFNRVRDREKEIWDGYRAGQAGAKELFGAECSYHLFQNWRKAPADLFRRQTNIHCPLGQDKKFDALLLMRSIKFAVKVRGGSESPLAFVDSTQSVHEMRLLKSEHEIA